LRFKESFSPPASAGQQAAHMRKRVVGAIFYIFFGNFEIRAFG
jgi:hypothetical protein